MRPPPLDTNTIVIRPSRNEACSNLKSYFIFLLLILNDTNLKEWPQTCTSIFYVVQYRQQYGKFTPPADEFL